MDNPRFVTPEDLETLDKWFKSHGMDPITAHYLPKTGFIVDGVAAGFLYVTDSAVGWIENLISNKATSVEERNTALDLVVQAALSHAKSIGLECVVGFTELAPVADRAEKLGFARSAKPYTFVSRRLI